MTKNSQSFDFESAFTRLETILEQMNSNDISLDSSLTLFEEANGLIKQCGEKLNQAEQRVTKLVKERTGDLTLDEMGRPEQEEFPTQGV